MGSLSIWHWLIVLAIVTMVFGTRRLRSAGTDLGAAVRNFKDAVRDGEAAAQDLRSTGQQAQEALAPPARTEGVPRS